MRKTYFLNAPYYRRILLRFHTFIETCFLIGFLSGSSLPDDQAFISSMGHCTYPAVATEGNSMYLVYLIAETRPASVYFQKSADEGKTWSDARKISDETGDCMPPSIAVASEIIHCAWVDCDKVIDGELYYTQSLDGGETWEKNAVLVSNVSSANYPLISSEGSNVYLIWQDVQTRVFFKASRDRGRTWENEMLLGKVGKHSCYCFPPALLANGREVMVVWNDLKEIKKGSGPAFLCFFPFKADKNKLLSSAVCRKSADSGRTWSKEYHFTSAKVSRETTDEVDNPTLFSDGSCAYLFWQDKHAIPLGEILFAVIDTATSKGRIRGKPFFPIPKRSPKCPSVVFDNDKNLHCAWTSFFHGKSTVHYGSIDPAGNIIKEKKDLTAAAERYENPTIARTGSGMLHLFWFNKSKDKDKPSRIFLKTSGDNGLTWEYRRPQTEDMPR
jgi:hypothetical protein